MNKSGRVVRWDADRGFGFIRSPQTDADVFFLVRDFHGPGSPMLDMAVSFEEIHVGGKGPRAMAVRGLDTARSQLSGQRVRPRQGRTPVPRSPAGARRDPWLWPVLVAGMAWGVCLLWAAMAGRLPGWTLPAWVALNLWTFAAYWRDKWAAQKGHRRTPEDTLHLWSLLGGWPVARVAQQVLRHKSAKASFQRSYWLTIVLHMGVVAAWLLATAEPDALLRALR